MIVTVNLVVFAILIVTGIFVVIIIIIINIYIVVIINIIVIVIVVVIVTIVQLKHRHDWQIHYACIITTFFDFALSPVVALCLHSRHQKSILFNRQFS